MKAKDVMTSTVISVQPNADALVNEAGAIFHLDLLLLGSPRTLAHFLRLFVRHHLFRCGGLHRSWQLR